MRGLKLLALAGALLGGWETCGGVLIYIVTKIVGVEQCLCTCKDIDVTDIVSC